MWTLLWAVVLRLEPARWVTALIVSIICAGLAMASWGETKFSLPGLLLVMGAGCAGGLRSAKRVLHQFLNFVSKLLLLLPFDDAHVVGNDIMEKTMSSLPGLLLVMVAGRAGGLRSANARYSSLQCHSPHRRASMQVLQQADLSCKYQLTMVYNVLQVRYSSLQCMHACNMSAPSAEHVQSMSSAAVSK